MVGNIFELLALTGLLAAGALLLGTPLALLARLRTSDFFALAPLAGIACLEVSAWWALDVLDVGVHALLPWLYAGAIAATVILWLSGFRLETGAARVEATDTELRSLGALGGTAFLATSTFLVHARGLLRLEDLTIGSLGNNDAASYAIMAGHVATNGFSEAGPIAGNHLGELARSDVTGMYALLAGANWLGGHAVWETALSVLLLGVLLVGLTTCHLLLRTTRLGGSLIALLAAVSVNVFLFTYVTWHYFASQLFAMAALPVLLYLLLDKGNAFERRTAIAAVGLVLAHLLLVYPHMAFLLPPSLLGVLVIDQGVLRNARSRAIGGLALLSLGSLLAVLLVPSRIGIAIDRLLNLEETVAGWPLPDILPWSLIGFQTSFRATTTAGLIVASLALVAECLASWRRRISRGEAGGFPLVGVVVVVLATQAVFSLFRNSDYEHWKWISFFQPLLTITLLLPFVIGLSVWASGIWLKPARRAPLFLLAGMLLVVVSNSLVATRPLGDDSRTLLVDSHLAAVSDTVNEVIPDGTPIALANGAYWQSMWSAALLAPRPVSFLDEVDPYFERSPSAAAPVLIEAGQVDDLRWLPLRSSDGRFALLDSPPTGPGSRTAENLSAELEVSLSPGPDFTVSGTYRITNTGSAHWLGRRGGNPGEVNLGVQTVAHDGSIVNRNHHRIHLVDWPLWIPPGATLSGSFTLPDRPHDESATVRFVPVAEHVAWFDDLGTEAVDLGNPLPNSASGDRLSSAIAAKITRDGNQAILEYRISNTGTSHWLGSHTGQVGEVNLTVMPLDASGSQLLQDHQRIPLVPWPLSVAPGQEIEGEWALPELPLETTALRIVPVAEHVGWFDTFGSPPTDVPLQ